MTRTDFGGLLSRFSSVDAETVVRYVVLAVVLTFVIFPVYWMFAGAIQNTASLFGGDPNIVPTEITFENFGALFERTEAATYFVNSVIVTSMAVVLSTTISTLGGYSLSRFEFRGKTALARSVLFAYMFSPIVLGIPLYIIFYRLGLLNSYVSIAIAQSAIAVPFGIWLMWQYFQSIPLSVEESAWMQGAGYFRTFWDIALPMARPGYITTAIFSFAISWADFTMAKIILTDTDSYTIMVGAAQFLERTDVGWGMTMATGVLIVIPPFLIVLFLQDYLLQGFDLEP
jgi:multiple sugar transport system permease protein